MSRPSIRLQFANSFHFRPYQKSNAAIYFRCTEVLAGRFHNAGPEWLLHKTLWLKTTTHCAISTETTKNPSKPADQPLFHPPDKARFNNAL
jgi:hypothetical protein